MGKLHIVTENHLLSPSCRSSAAWSARCAAARLTPEPEGAYIGVMKRSGAADIVWFRAESCYVFHVMNAWEEGNHTSPTSCSEERRC
jgi:carotenoid cleavage dioxygenase